MDELRVRLFGGLTVEGLTEQQVGSRQARTVVKVLTLARGRPVAADRLTDALWPDGLPAKPVEQLRVLASRLRGVLGVERLVRSDAGWSLDVDWFDAAHAESQLDLARAAWRGGDAVAARDALDDALRCVRGELLADEPDAPWAEAERRAAARRVGELRLLAAQVRTALGDPRGAAGHARAALADDPYDEPALVELMRAEVAAGRPAAALAAYAEMRRRLAEDLGVGPGADVEALHDAVLLHGATDAVPVQDRGGADAGAAAAASLVGRRAELGRLDAAFAALVALGNGTGPSGIVELVGEPGSGKTHLAQTWADRQRTMATVLTIRCRPVGVELALQPVLDALDAHLRALGPRRAAEVLGPDAPLLEGLLVGVPGATVPTALPVDAAAGDAGVRAAAGLGVGGVDAVSPLGVSGLGSTGGAGADAGGLGGAPGLGAVATVGGVDRRMELFAALVRVVVRAGGGGPVVVVVDDADRADPSTTAWLGLLVRRVSGVLVVATRPADAASLGGSVIEVGPLDVDAVAVLVGRERAAALHERTGGHALFVAELVAAPPGVVPSTLQAAVLQRSAALGEAADDVLRAAAVIDGPLDVDLLGALVDRPDRDVARAIDQALAAGLLAARDAGVVFRHELIRECLVDAATGRATLLHRDAARLLAERPRHDPLAVARHARLGGDAGIAGPALIAAAQQAFSRHDATSAATLLDEAVALGPDPAALVARARLRMASWDHDRAAADVEAALDLGAGLDAWELAGWIAYYRRDHAAAVRYAETAMELAADTTERAGGATLLGRIEHTRGRIARADALLVEAVAAGTPGTRGIARVWLATLRGHQGRAAEAADLAERGLLTARNASHPFGHLHGLFAIAYAAGIAGDADGLWRGSARLRAAAAAAEIVGARFVASADNLDGWFLRATGDPSADRQRELVESLPTTTEFSEQRIAGLLDVAEHALVHGRLDAAASTLGAAAWVEDWFGSMHWHQRQRYRALRARLALCVGEPDAALAFADAVQQVVADADPVRAMRYVVTARLVAAQAGRHEGLSAVAEDLRRLAVVSGLDGWLVAGDTVAALGVDAWWPIVADAVAGVRHSLADLADRTRFDAFVATRMTGWHRF